MRNKNRGKRTADHPPSRGASHSGEEPFSGAAGEERTSRFLTEFLVMLRPPVCQLRGPRSESELPGPRKVCHKGGAGYCVSTPPRSLAPTPPPTEGQRCVSPFLPISPQRWGSRSHGVSNPWAFSPIFFPVKRFLTHRHLISTEDSLLLKPVVALRVRVRPPGWSVLSQGRLVTMTPYQGCSAPGCRVVAPKTFPLVS